MLPLDDKMLAETFPETLCLTPIESHDTHGLSNKNEFIEHPSTQSITDVDVHGVPQNNSRNMGSSHNSSHDPHKKLQALISSHKGRVRWTASDTLILITAKQVEKSLYSDGSLKRTKFATEKWKAIAAHCQKNGLVRTATQCKDRWEHILPDYKKIKYYGRDCLLGHESYWNMSAKERIDNKLPTNYTKEIYDAMERYFCQNLGNNSADMIVDTSAPEIRTFDEYQFPLKCSPLHENVSLESQLESPSDSSLDRDDQNARKKQKVGSSDTDVAIALSDHHKNINSSLKQAEDGNMKRHERYCSLFERRMKMDEKYLNHHAMIVQRMVNTEEQKVKVQCDIVAALHNIGQAMLRICDSVGPHVFMF